MGMAANWEKPADEPTPKPIEPDDTATVIDIERFRSVRPEQVVPPIYIPEPDMSLTDEQAAAVYAERRIRQHANEVDELTLQRETRIQGHGGGSKSKIKEVVRPLTGPERIEAFIRRVKADEGGTFEPETDEQRARRLTLENQKRILEKEKRRGRPRKQEEKLEVVGARVAPATKAFFKHVDLGTLLDTIVANMQKDPDAREVLTQPKLDDTIAA